MAVRAPRRCAGRTGSRFANAHRAPPPTGRTLRHAAAATDRGSRKPRRPRGQTPQEDGGSVEVKPGYKQTEVGMIPEEWEVRGLLKTVRIANGQVDPRNEPYRTMILVAPDHIEGGTGKLLEKRTAADQQAISGKYVFHAGDVVYSKIRPYLQKAILAEFDGLCSADMYPLTPAADVSAGFILAVLLAHRFTKYAESVSVRSGMP